MLVSCAKAPEAALLPLPKLVEYTGGSVKADTPVTETLPFMVAGILHNGITRVSYGPTSAVYNTIFENPPVPVLSGASE